MTLGDAETSDAAAVLSVATAAAEQMAAPEETAVAADAAPANASIAQAEKDPTAASKKRGREPSSDEMNEVADAAESLSANATAAAAATDDAETEEEDKEAAKKARASLSSSSPPPKKKGARPPKKPQGDEKVENPKKRKAPAKKGKKDAEAAAADEGEETESEPEKQPKKRAKPAAAAAKEKKSPARRKKPVKEVVESSDSEDEEQQEVLRRVEALDPEVTAKFGSIVWAKMVGFPFWPAMVTDPRLLPSRLQASAVKDLETKYLVYFYSTKNFAPTLFKNIAAWEDTKYDYRSGFPAKDSKAPKRRAQLMEAIAEADKDLLLPIEERVNGLLKPSEEEPKVKKPTREDGAGSKRGKQHAFTARKSGKVATERKTAGKSNADKVAEDDEETVDERSQESHEEDEENSVARSLSKDEIKAKVASRKTPSKKKVAGDDAEAKAKAGGAAKKAAGGAGKSSGKASSASDDIDTKRKKEIELMVPRKSVKSADIREMTEEAAKKSLAGGAKDKAKSDKGDYKVGDLNSFAVKLTRLHMNESAKNNDEVIRMLAQLFEEKLVYRSDVERSGIASIIAQLRKSTNPTVAQTASAVRKHMITIMVHDTGADGDKSAGTAPKAETDSKAKKPKEPKASEKKSEVKGDDAMGDVKSESTAAAQKAANGAKKVKPSASKDSAVKKMSDAVSAEKTPVEASTSAPATADATSDKASGVAEGSPKQDDKDASGASSGVLPPSASEVVATEKAGGEAIGETTPAATKETGSAPAATPAAEPRDSSAKKADASLDAHRQAFIDMLSNVLDPSGAAHVNLAKEIEEFVFDRYKESNDDYRVQARKITFGLKKNANLRERLISGALHGLELVYADDKFFEASP